MTRVISVADLPGKTAHLFEGYKYDDTPVSFFLTNTPPGKAVQLHTHPYQEVFIVQEGQLRFTVGDEIIDTVAGQIVIVPPATQHRFLNTGSVIARHVDIHLSPRMIVTWLEEDATG